MELRRHNENVLADEARRFDWAQAPLREVQREGVEEVVTALKAVGNAHHWAAGEAIRLLLHPNSNRERNPFHSP